MLSMVRSFVFVVHDDEQTLMEVESTFPSERDPKGTFTPVNLASELKVQVGCCSDAERRTCVFCHTLVLVRAILYV